MSDPQIDPLPDSLPEPEIVPGTSRPIPVDPTPGADPDRYPQTHPDPAEEAAAGAPSP